MAVFKLNADVVTDVPKIEVTLSPETPLSLGRHRFRLLVVDDSGNKSVPDEVVILVADQENPTAVINAPGVVPFGRSFALDGTKSFDVGGGKISQFVWTYLGPAT